LLATLVLTGIVIAKIYPYEGFPEWLGIKRDTNKSVSLKMILKCRVNSNISSFDQAIKECRKDSTTSSVLTKNEKDGSVEITTLESEQSAKTLWDLLGLFGALGIPLAVYLFQVGEQKRSNGRLEAEGKRAEENLCEQAFLNYVENISKFVLDKDRLTKLTRFQHRDSAEIDIVRTLTLTIMRRLRNDEERYDRFFYFLKDSGLSQVVFREAAENPMNLDFSKANLSGSNFTNSNLTGATFVQADLSRTSFSGAILSKAKLRGVNFEFAEICGADLTDADLTQAKLAGANFLNTKLNNVQLDYADLTNTSLIGADLTGASLLNVKGLSAEQIVDETNNWNVGTKYNDTLDEELNQYRNI
jgi:hypothetical protein